jgi:hypothetical protein
MTLPQYRDALKKWLKKHYPDADAEGMAMQMKEADQEWASAIEVRANDHPISSKVVDSYLKQYGQSAFRAFRTMPGVENYSPPWVRHQKRQIYVGHRSRRSAFGHPRLTR